MGSSDWTELAIVTAQIDELRSSLDDAEATDEIAAIYRLEEKIGELEEARQQLLSQLIDRVVDEAAA